MIKVKIESNSGFGKTAEFAGVHLMHYDLATGKANVILTVYEESPVMTLQDPTEYFLTQTMDLSSEDLATWGTDNMTLVDLVLAKAGFVRDLTWTPTQE